MREGDPIEIDVATRKLQLEVTAAELATQAAAAVAKVKAAGHATDEFPGRRSAAGEVRMQLLAAGAGLEDKGGRRAAVGGSVCAAAVLFVMFITQAWMFMKVGAFFAGRGQRVVATKLEATKEELKDWT